MRQSKISHLQPRDRAPLSMQHNSCKCVCVCENENESESSNCTQIKFIVCHMPHATCHPSSALATAPYLPVLTSFPLSCYEFTTHFTTTTTSAPSIQSVSASRTTLFPARARAAPTCLQCRQQAEQRQGIGSLCAHFSAFSPNHLPAPVPSSVV